MKAVKSWTPSIGAGTWSWLVSVQNDPGLSNTDIHKAAAAPAWPCYISWSRVSGSGHLRTSGGSRMTEPAELGIVAVNYSRAWSSANRVLTSSSKGTPATFWWHSETRINIYKILTGSKQYFTNIVIAHYKVTKQHSSSQKWLFGIQYCVSVKISINTSRVKKPSKWCEVLVFKPYGYYNIIHT